MIIKLRKGVKYFTSFFYEKMKIDLIILRTKNVVLKFLSKHGIIY